MGETRTKKSKKRVPKVVQSTDNVSNIKNAFHHLEVETLGNDANGKASTSQSDSHLAPPTLFSRASRSSFQSSSSSSSKAARHEFDVYEPSRVEVQYTPHKGYALFAASHIPKGDIVLAEIPAIRLTAEDEVKKLETDEILMEKFSQLAKRSQKEFKKIHDAKKDGFTKLRSIYHSNCYNLEGSRSELGGSCIGLTASRINHSCIPNVQFAYHETIPEHLFRNTEDDDDDAGSVVEQPDPRAGVMVFRALKAIPKGKEIVANYESVYATKSQRQSQFQMHYGFRCDCDACTGPTDFWERDDDRRLEMIRYRNKIDAIERRVVMKREAILNASEVDAYYLKSKKSKDETSSINADDLSPLDLPCCNEMKDTLKALERLLVKEGLMGIELRRVREEMTLWEKRAESCVWGTYTSC